MIVHGIAALSATSLTAFHSPPTPPCFPYIATIPRMANSGHHQDESPPSQRRRHSVAMAAGLFGGIFGGGEEENSSNNSYVRSANADTGKVINNSGKGPTNEVVKSVNGMRQRRLGGSDIVVSELGLGTQRW